eukprot:tig00000042_g15392.t1
MEAVLQQFTERLERLSEKLVSFSSTPENQVLIAAVAAGVALPVAALYGFRRRRTTKATKSRRAAGDDAYDVIIVGAGVAGSAMAFRLGEQGRRVLCLERDLREPDRIVGELLQPGGVRRLTELGLAETMNGIDSVPVKGYAVYLDGQSVRCPYPTYGEGATEGRSFHHGPFVMNLRKAARGQKNVVLKQGTVLRLLDEDSRVAGVAYKDESEKVVEVKAPLTLVCDGVGSGLRANIMPAKPKAQSHFVGLVLEDCKLPVPSSGHVILANPSPILFYPISSREVRCLIDIPGKSLPSVSTGEMAKYITTNIVPQVPPEIQPYLTKAVEAGRIRSMPNNEMVAQKVYQPGAMLLGDSFNCRHPLTGGGMTVAFSDVKLISDLIAEVPDLYDDKAMRNVSEQFYHQRKAYASTINILAAALYAVFSASREPILKEMRAGCFEYFKLGGQAVSGPMSLLSGMNPRPLHLIVHFSMVAFYGVYRMLCPFPTPVKLFKSFLLIRAAARIVTPLIMAERLFWFLPAGDPVGCASTCA